MIPSERGEKIEWIQKQLLPLFDSQLNEVREEDLDVANVERSEEILAEEYLDEGRGILTNFAKVGVPLVVIDALTSMPPQVYGLVFSITGTMIMLVQADILGSRSITAQSLGAVGGGDEGETGLDEGEVRRLARNSVITNIGLVWLILGFMMQLVAVWFVAAETDSTRYLSHRGLSDYRMDGVRCRTGVTYKKEYKNYIYYLRTI